MFRLNIFIVSVLLGITSAFAQETSLPSGDFLVPNEVNPELTIPILENAPSGAYIAVGTERGFIHAALAPTVTHLRIADRDEAVVLYAKINTELLRASAKPGLSVREKRERYKLLRLESSFEDCQEDLRGFNYISQKKYFDWFTKIVRGRTFLDFNTPPKTSRLAAFRNANYLFDDKMFGKIQTMAEDGKIESEVLDFGTNSGQFNRKAVEAFLSRLEQAKIPISVFDLSNAWTWKYLGPTHTDELAKMLMLNPLTTGKSLFLITNYDRSQYYKNGERAKSPWITLQGSVYQTNAHYEYDWKYHGYTFEFLTTHPFRKILNGTMLKESTLNNSAVGCDGALLP